MSGVILQPGADERNGGARWRQSRTSLQWVWLGALVANVLLAVAALANALRVPSLPEPRVLLLGLYAGAAVGAGLGAVLVWREWGHPRGTARSLRMLFACHVAGWCAQVVWLQPYSAPWGSLGVASAFGVFALLASSADRWTRAMSPRAVRGADVILFNIAAALLAGELILRGAGALLDRPLFDQASMDRATWLRRHRMKPGEMYLGFPIDSRGYYDEELRPRKPGERLIVSIGDSFSLGVVPHAYHFTTVAERILGDAEIYNVGVPGADPPEYFEMLRGEVIAMRPDLIVVNIFVGNDYSAQAIEPRHGLGLGNWFDRGNVLIAQVPRRLLALYSERGRSGGVVGDAPGASAIRNETHESLTDPVALERAMPWLADPLQERPSFSTEAFLEIECARAERLCAPQSNAGARIASSIDALVAAAGDIPIAFVVIPDEFQVEDALWKTIIERSSTPIERDQPQRVLAEIFARRGLHALDLLPDLRAVPADSSGARHVYHLRDTHFNARGNLVAATALAHFLRAPETSSARQPTIR
jgi:hypothetical protein